MEKSIGFLSFGRYSEQEGSPVATARDALHQTIELAVEAEKLGVETAWVRSHHFEMSFSSPMPLLTAMASRTESMASLPERAGTTAVTSRPSTETAT